MTVLLHPFHLVALGMRKVKSYLGKSTMLTGQELTGRDWLDHHIKTFIKPNITEMPDVKTCPGDSYTPQLRNDLYTKALMELWEAAVKKAEGKTILLPGRDVWLFEVLARLRGDKTIFRGDISSGTYTHVAKNDPDKEVLAACYGVDSGLSGSVPRGLKCVDFGLVYHSAGGAPKALMPYDPYRHGCYSILEGGSKYWTRGALEIKVVDDKDTFNIIQKIDVGSQAFKSATVNTILVAEAWLKIHEAEWLKAKLAAQATAPTMIVKPKVKMTLSALRRRRLARGITSTTTFGVTPLRGRRKLSKTGLALKALVRRRRKIL